MPITIETLEALGLTAEQILGVLKIQREDARNRKRKSRANGHVTVTGRSRDMKNAGNILKKDTDIEVTSVTSISECNLAKAAKRKTAFPDPWPWPIRTEHEELFADFRGHALEKGRRSLRWDIAWQRWQTSPLNKPNGGHRNGKGRYIETTTERGKRLADACREREQEFGFDVFGTPHDVRSR